MPFKANEDRRHKIPRARYRVENWRSLRCGAAPTGRLDGVGDGCRDRGMDAGLATGQARSTAAILCDGRRNGPDAAAGFWAALAPD